MQSPNSIVITGASSGLGATLAEAYARPGAALGLLGRNAARLNEVASACIQKGAVVETGVIDVTDRQAMRQWIEAFDKGRTIDLLIANAGISAGTGKTEEAEQQDRNLLAINVEGVLNSIWPVIGSMRARRRGQIAIMSSLASLRGLPSCPAYSASKAAVRTLGEGLRGELKKYNVEVSVICPGYIRTPMTAANKFPMPFMMSAEKAAAIIIKGLARNKPRIAFPWQLYYLLLLTGCLPLRLTDMFFAALPKKSSMEKT